MFFKSYFFFYFFFFFTKINCNYENYKLYSIDSSNNDDFKIINEINQEKLDKVFYDLMNNLYDKIPISYWKLNINSSIFSIPSKYQLQVEDYFLNNSLTFKLLDNNLQDKINNEREFYLFNDNYNSKTFKLDSYHNLNEINEYLRILAKEYKDTVRCNIIGKTFESKEILSITVRKKSSVKRPVVIIDAGLHPREWITHSSALYLISKLILYFNPNYSHTVLDQLSFKFNQTEADLLTTVDWVIIPVLNPDGYSYTWLQDRLWKKNRSVPKTLPKRAPWNLFQDCLGVDLNRNFEYYFANSAYSSNPCNENFVGDKAFSELETLALKNLVLSNRPNAYLSLHSFSQIINFPNSINRGKLPNHEELKTVSKRMALEAKEVGGIKYRYGTLSQFKYTVTGDSVSWANLNGINLTYSISLRDTGTYGYLLPKDKIIPTGEELTKFVFIIADELKKSFKPF